MRGGQCLKVWTKKQQVVSLSTPRERAVRRSENRIRRAGDPERGKGLGNIVRAQSTPGRLSDDVPGQPQRVGHVKPADTGGIPVKNRPQRFNKTRKTCAVQRENGVFLLPAKSQNVNSVATLSPSDAGDHSDVHVEEAGSARTKHCLNDHLQPKLRNMGSRTCP